MTGLSRKNSKNTKIVRFVRKVRFTIIMDLVSERISPFAMTYGTPFEARSRLTVAPFLLLKNIAGKGMSLSEKQRRFNGQAEKVY